MDQRDFAPTQRRKAFIGFFDPEAREYACKNSGQPKPTRPKHVPYVMTEHSAKRGGKLNK